MSSLLVVHAAATWFMVGLIWTIQVVHYPLFHRVGVAGFREYEAGHTQRMGGLLAIPAGIEVITAAGLVWFRPDAVGLPMVLVAGSLLAAIWVMTAVVQVRLHRRLSGGYDAGAVAALVASNRWRTAAWTARGLLVAWLAVL